MLKKEEKEKIGENSVIESFSFFFGLIHIKKNCFLLNYPFTSIVLLKSKDHSPAHISIVSVHSLKNIIHAHITSHM